MGAKTSHRAWQTSGTNADIVATPYRQLKLMSLYEFPEARNLETEKKYYILLNIDFFYSKSRPNVYCIHVCKA